MENKDTTFQISIAPITFALTSLMELRPISKFGTFWILTKKKKKSSKLEAIWTCYQKGEPRIGLKEKPNLSVKSGIKYRDEDGGGG